jgi:hypothetical protein
LELFGWTADIAAQLQYSQSALHLPDSRKRNPLKYTNGDRPDPRLGSGGTGLE